MKKGPFRTAAGFCLGAFAGVSLTLTVLPFVLSLLLGANTMDVVFRVNDFALPMALVWAVVGAALGRVGGMRNGALLLGVCGALSGIILAAFGVEGNLATIGVSALGCLAYGAVGGLILGRVFTD